MEYSLTPLLIFHCHFLLVPQNQWRHHERVTESTLSTHKDNDLTRQRTHSQCWALMTSEARVQSHWRSLNDATAPSYDDVKYASRSIDDVMKHGCQHARVMTAAVSTRGRGWEVSQSCWIPKQRRQSRWLIQNFTIQNLTHWPDYGIRDYDHHVASACLRQVTLVVYTD